MVDRVQHETRQSQLQELLSQGPKDLAAPSTT